MTSRVACRRGCRATLHATAVALAAVLMCCVSAWDVAGLYGTPLPPPPLVRLVDVAVWRNRAYACWPRADPSQPVTLLELPWPETGGELPPRWKPRGPFRTDQQVRARDRSFFNKLLCYSLLVYFIFLNTKCNYSFYAVFLYNTFWSFTSIKKKLNFGIV